MKSRLPLRLLLCVPVLLALAAPVSAAPITINFEGQWNFLDFEWKYVGCEVLPEQCAFVQGLAALGVTDGSTISFSLTLDTQTPDSDPSVTYGLYANAATGHLGLGSNSYSLAPTSVTVAAGQPGQLNLFGSLGGPALHGYGMTMLPAYFQFMLSNVGFASDVLTSNLTNFSAWSPSIFVGFRAAGGGGLNLGVAQLHVTSVPEPNTLTTLSGILLAIGVYAGRRGIARWNVGRVS